MSGNFFPIYGNDFSGVVVTGLCTGKVFHILLNSIVSLLADFAAVILMNSVHFGSSFGAVMKRSFSPRHDILHTTIVSGGSVGRILSAYAIPWADSSAGKSHSVLIQTLRASSASLSVADTISIREIDSRYAV